MESGKKPLKIEVRTITLSAALVAMALILGLVEQWIPLAITIPGIKIGLPNIVTVFAIYVLGPIQALCILFVRCILGAIFAGNFTSLVFSLFGGLFAFGVMFLLSRSRHLSPLGVSAGGACAHSIGQILAAMLLLGSAAPVAYLPLMMLVSIVTGILTGTASCIVLGTLNGSIKLAEKAKGKSVVEGEGISLESLDKSPKKDLLSKASEDLDEHAQAVSGSEEQVYTADIWKLFVGGYDNVEEAAPEMELDRDSPSAVGEHTDDDSSGNISDDRDSHEDD